VIALPCHAKRTKAIRDIDPALASLRRRRSSFSILLIRASAATMNSIIVSAA
jgi:hypothetical protein